MEGAVQQRSLGSAQEDGVPELVLTIQQFRDADNKTFRLWLKASGMETFEAALPLNSCLVPSDLFGKLFVDGPAGLLHILQDEVGEIVEIKLHIVERLRREMAIAAGMRPPGVVT
jgi:hypothetical protein